MWRIKLCLAWLLVIIVRLLEPRRVQRGANGCFFGAGALHRPEDPDA